MEEYTAGVAVCWCVYEHLGEFLNMFWQAQLFQSVFSKIEPSPSRHKQRHISQLAIVRIGFKKKTLLFFMSANVF